MSALLLILSFVLVLAKYCFYSFLDIKTVQFLRLNLILKFHRGPALGQVYFRYYKPTHLMFDFTFPDVQLQDVMVQAISLVTTRLTEGMAR